MLARCRQYARTGWTACRHRARTAFRVASHHRVAVVGILAGGVPYVLPHLPGRCHVSGHLAAVLSAAGAAVSLLVKGINPPAPADAVHEIVNDSGWVSEPVAECPVKVERPAEPTAKPVAPEVPAAPPTPQLNIPSGGSGGSAGDVPSCRGMLGVSDDQIKQIIERMDRAGERAERLAREFVETFTKPSRPRKKK